MATGVVHGVDKISGGASLLSGNATAQLGESGKVTVGSGESLEGRSGNVSVRSGGSNGTSGSVIVTSGTTKLGTSGETLLRTGDSESEISGDISIQGGYSVRDGGGNVNVVGGSLIKNDLPGKGGKVLLRSGPADGLVSVGMTCRRLVLTAKRLTMCTCRGAQAGTLDSRRGLQNFKIADLCSSPQMMQVVVGQVEPLSSAQGTQTSEFPGLSDCRPDRALAATLAQEN